MPANKAAGSEESAISVHPLAVLEAEEALVEVDPAAP